MIKLYRAMNEIEKSKTLFYQSLQFNRNREKCFSHNLNWITTRVQNGKFNNSNCVTDRYRYLLEFGFEDSSIAAFSCCNNNEWKTNIRKLPLIKLVQITDITIKEYNHVNININIELQS